MVKLVYRRILWLLGGTGVIGRGNIRPRDITNAGRRSILIAMRDGAVLEDRHPATGSAGDIFIAWQFPLHSGQAFGIGGRLLVLSSAIGTILLFVVGLYLWWKKRGMQKSAHGGASRHKRPLSMKRVYRITCLFSLLYLYLSSMRTL